MRIYKDLVGSRFGKLVVIKLQGRDNTKALTWLCKCDCGNETIVRGTALICSGTESCGCNHITCTHTTHNGSHTRLYRIFNNMKTRCYNEANQKYKSYGLRGITICDEWINDFEKFSEWALDNGYKDKLTIDRINNNGNYEPKNCRWATNIIQANNKRTNIFYEINGIKHTLKEWCKLNKSDYMKVWHEVRGKNGNITTALNQFKEGCYI